MTSRDDRLLTPEQLDAWRKAAAKSAPGGDVDALGWHTPEGLVVKPLYTAADTAELPHVDTLPGFAPFLRGPQATMYAVRPWTIRQYAGFSTAEESNAFYRARWPRADRVSASRSTSPPIAATTATTRASRATSARRASRSTASRT
jgi:methylmalonyl-CoA mutase N-terminal domain/subunit